MPQARSFIFDPKIFPPSIERKVYRTMGNVLSAQSIDHSQPLNSGTLCLQLRHKLPSIDDEKIGASLASIENVGLITTFGDQVQLTPKFLDQFK